MSTTAPTTERSPTTEQLLFVTGRVLPTTVRSLPTIEQLIPLIEKACRDAVSSYPLRPYTLPFITNIAVQPFIASACLERCPNKEDYKDINAISGFTCESLSRNLRWKISKTADAVRKFTVVLYPGEKLEKASLFLIKHEESTPEYVLIKSVVPEGDSFSFFGDVPLSIAGFPYHTFSLEVTIQHCQTDQDRVMLVERFMYLEPIRGKILRDVYNTCLGIDKTQSPQEDLDTEKVLQDMRKCPECGQHPVLICNCEYRDSKCPNGHRWYYDKKTNSIKKGTGH